MFSTKLVRAEKLETLLGHGHQRPKTCSSQYVLSKGFPFVLFGLVVREGMTIISIPLSGYCSFYFSNLY